MTYLGSHKTAWICSRSEWLAFCSQLFMLVLLCCGALPAVRCLVYTDGNIAVELDGNTTDNFTSCRIFSARYGFEVSPILKAIPLDETIETGTPTIRSLREQCLLEPTSTNLVSEFHFIKKRSIFHLFSGIYPGTKWCGTGDVADNDHDLGRLRSTDKCCREHDRCPHYILPFRRKFGLFNKSPFTVSSCDCDDDFRGCLDRVDSFASRMVEILFFNVARNGLRLKCIPTIDILAALSKATDIDPPQQQEKSKPKKQPFARWFFKLFSPKGD